MISSWLGATMALAMMTGVALAQNSPSSTTSTQSTTSAPVLGATSVSVTQRTTDSDGAVTELTQTSTSDSTDSPSGGSPTVRKTTETTTVR